MGQAPRPHSGRVASRTHPSKGVWPYWFPSRTSCWIHQCPDWGVVDHGRHSWTYSFSFLRLLGPSFSHLNVGNVHTGSAWGSDESWNQSNVPIVGSLLRLLLLNPVSTATSESGFFSRLRRLKTYNTYAQLTPNIIASIIWHFVMFTKKSLMPLTFTKWWKRLHWQTTLVLLFLGIRIVYLYIRLYLHWNWK